MLKKNIILCSLVLIVNGLISPVQAIAASALTLKQITALALEHNPDLNAARYNVSIAKARLIQAGLWSNPSLNLNNDDDKVFSNEGEYTRSVSFSQAFPISGRLRQQKKLARIDVEKAIVEIREAERQLTANVANTFYSLIITKKRQALQNDLLKLTKRLIQVTRKHQNSGEVSELDSNSAQLEYQRILQEYQLLVSTNTRDRYKLNQLLGRPLTSPLALKPSLPPSISPPLNTLMHLALKNRPDRQLVLLNIQRANTDLHLAQAERMADWTLGLGVQQDKIVVEGAPPQTADRSLAINLSIPLPLFNQNQGRILETRANGTQAMMSLKALNATIETQVASNHLQFNQLQLQVKKNQQQSLLLSKKNLQLASKAYRNGQLSVLNFIQVQRQQHDLQLLYLATLKKYLQTYVALCTAVGIGDSSAFCHYISYKRNLYAHAEVFK